MIASVQDIFEAQTFSFSSYFDLIKNATILVLVVALSLSLVKNYRWKKLEQENQKALGEIAAVLNEAFNNEDSKKLMESIDAKLADKGSP